jgi:hypothetical protein
MGKRANNQASKTAAKKAKVDPALAAVMDTVKKAGHLPEQCPGISWANFRTDFFRKIRKSGNIVF